MENRAGDTSRFTASAGRPPAAGTPGADPAPRAATRGAATSPPGIAIGGEGVSCHGRARSPAVVAMGSSASSAAVDTAAPRRADDGGRAGEAHSWRPPATRRCRPVTATAC